MRIKTAILPLILLCNSGYSQYWIYRNVDDLRNSVNIGLNGIHTTSLYLNYERLISPSHGICVGLPIIRSKKQPEIGVSLNYRYHFRQDLNTFYLGLFTNYSKIDGIVYETINGRASREYSNVNRIFAFGPMIGKRWINETGLNFAARIGYGFCFAYNVWDEDFNDQDFKDFSEKTDKIIGSIDLELTIGFAFNLKRK